MYTYNKDDKSYTFSSDDLGLDIDIDLNPENNARSDDNLIDDENNENEVKQPQKKIEVINGGNDLDISPVTNYIEIEKPKSDKKDNIIVPEEKR